MKRAYLNFFCIFISFLLTARGEDSTVVVLFAGDLNFSAHFENSFKEGIPNIFEKWNNAENYDLMMVNLENAITTSDDPVKKEFVFKMKPELLPLLKEVKSIVNCANNHTADFRIEGILETIKYLEDYNINYVGIGRNLEEARKPVIKNINGIKIGFLGYAEIGTYIAKQNSPGRAPLRVKYMIEDIKKLKEQVDYVVINLHWGTELAKYPSVDQIKIAHKIIDAGADLIIGHHPHILQGIEKYKNKIIAYSLGNFIFGGNKNAENSETAIIKAKYSKFDMLIEVIPVTVRNWKPEVADEQTKKKIIAIIKERSEIFKENSIFYIDGKSKIN